MARSVTATTTLVWVLLMGITGASWLLGASAAGDASHVRGVHFGAMIALLLLTLFKVRLVIMHFMEVRTAPWQLRALFDLWLVGVGVALLATYAVSL